MSQPYVGEIRIFAGNFAPLGWMTCDGQLLDIASNSTLFQLIGTTYGGDGQTTFALPNLTGRVPVHQGTGSTGTSYTIGNMAGTSTVTLTTQQIPAHSHSVVADGNASNTNQTAPANNFYGTSSTIKVFSPRSTSLHPMMTLAPAGGSQPHDNMQPYLALTYIISLFGIYPT